MYLSHECSLWGIVIVLARFLGVWDSQDSSRNDSVPSTSCLILAT